MHSGLTLYKVLSFTSVIYEQGNPLSFIFAVSGLTPIFIPIILIALLYSKRQLQILFILIGFVCNEAINYIIKHSLQHPRPYNPMSEHFFNQRNIFTELGMPSAHSQFVGFFVATISTVFPFTAHFLLHICFWILSIITAAGRVYLHYHYLDQVIVGSIIGFIFGILYRILVLQNASLMSYLESNFRIVKNCRLYSTHDLPSNYNHDMLDECYRFAMKNKIKENKYY